MRTRYPIAMLALALALVCAAPASAADRGAGHVFHDLRARLAATPASIRLPVIVRLQADPTDARLGLLADATSSFPVDRRFGSIDGFSTRLTPAQVLALAAAPGVRSIERDIRVHAVNDSSRASFGVSTARAQIPGLDGDHDGSPSTYSKSDEVAAVIDTGIDTGHVDLPRAKVVDWFDFVFGHPNPYDDNGHGTHVAATLAGTGAASAGRYAGVAPRAALVGLKALDSDGSADESVVLSALQYAISHRASDNIKTISMSLGSDGCSAGNDAISGMVNEATALGISVTAAAGNEGPASCTIGTPGAAASAITVGAMADFAAGGFFLADFSSRGPTVDGRVKPDVAAPGVNITSARAGTTSDYFDLDGTSMATPFVAGLTLLMRDARPGITAAQIKYAIARTAIDWGTRGQDNEYGYGRLDAYAALQAAGAALRSPPAEPIHRLFSTSFLPLGGTRDMAIPVTTTTWPLAATATKGGGLLGFSLALLDPSGNTVANTGSGSREDVLSHRPGVTGTYILRAHAATGGSFYVDVSGGVPAPIVRVASPKAKSVALTPFVTTAARAAAKALKKLGRRKLLRRHLFRFKATVPIAGRLGVRVVSRGRHRVTVAKGSHTFKAGGTFKLKVKTTRRGRRYVRRHPHAKLTVRVGFRDLAGRSKLVKKATKLKK